MVRSQMQVVKFPVHQAGVGVQFDHLDPYQHRLHVDWAMVTTNWQRSYIRSHMAIWNFRQKMIRRTIITSNGEFHDGVQHSFREIL